MDATWAIVGDDSLASVLALLERRLDTAVDTPGRPASLTGRAAAEALIRAFPGHFECRAPGDEACLGRLRATGRTSSNPLCDLVRDEVIAPGGCAARRPHHSRGARRSGPYERLLGTGRFRVTPHLRPASPAA
jgi:hypothetical protein